MKPVTFLAIGTVLAIAGLIWQAPGNAPPDPPREDRAPDTAPDNVTGESPAPASPHIETRQATRFFIKRENLPPETSAAYGVFAANSLPYCYGEGALKSLEG